MDDIKITRPTAEPCNAKSLLAFTFGLMGKLDRDEISIEKACAQAALISQANNIMKNEIARAALQLKMKLSGINISDSDIKLRQIESKAFD